MSAGQVEFDFDAIDADYDARVELVAGDWLHGDEDANRFVDALMACRRGPLGLINQDDVRLRLTEDTLRGPRISINHHRYSALWSTCRKEGLIAYHRDLDGEIVRRPARTSTTGNNRKPMPVYRWVGTNRSAT